MRSFRCFPALAALAAGLVLNAGQAYCAAYPTKPIRFIVAFPPGGNADMVARTIGQKLAERLGQQVVIDNRGGAGGIIGEDLAAKSAPDGYTIVLVAISHAVNPSLYKKLPYDAAKDFVPVALVVSVPNVLVVNALVPVKSVPELVALARAKPGHLNYASSGNGTSLHLAGELFKSMTGVDIVRVVYKGGALAATDLGAGQVQMMFAVITSGLSLAKTGRVRALGVTSAKRSAIAPDLPAISEFLPGYELSGWQGILAPAGTAAAIVTMLNVEIARILRMPDVQKRFRGAGAEPVGGTPDEFSAFLNSEVARWSRLLQSTGIRPE